jgi:hypothetical protein
MTRTLLLFGAFTGIFTLPAQQRPLHPDDANGDQRISRTEWRGNIAEFRQRDTNRDGVLSGTEIPQQGVADRGMPDRGQRGQGNADVRKLDKNASGVVEGYEWPYQPDIFHQLDSDGNSVLSADEFRNLSTLALKELDLNGNGRLDENEWGDRYADLQRLDANRDGRVTSNEYVEQGGEWQRRQRFDGWDSNRNGIIEATEWKAAPQLFHRLDTNGDTKVSWEEFRADRERYRPPYKWR